MAWPVHCEVGTWGHNVHAAVHAAYSRWEDHNSGIANVVSKGGNTWTEHYSAVRAEVPDPEDAATQLNHRLMSLLAQADRVFIGGEAGSHCVRATTEHLVDNLEAHERSKLVLLSDCMSPVSGFEAQYREFLRNMTDTGVQIATAAEVLQELLANAQD
jgi:nicotinamidase-related amidase